MCRFHSGTGSKMGHDTRTLYGVHCTPYIVRRTLYGVHCTAYIVRRTLYGVQIAHDNTT